MDNDRNLFWRRKMETLTEIAIECGAEVIRGQEQEGWENPVYDLEPEFVFTYTQLQSFVDAINNKAEIDKLTAEYKAMKNEQEMYYASLLKSHKIERDQLLALAKKEESE